MARLTVCLLGPFQVTLDGQLITSFATDKVRALLAYLAVEAGRPHRREKLAGLLWPDQPEGLARTNLRSTLARLRTSIRDREAEPPRLLITPQTLQLHTDASTSVDVTEFATLLQPCSAPTISQLEQAVALYRGPFLDSFSLPDSSLFEEWVLFQRERHHRLGMEALDNLVSAYESRGEFDRALEHAWRELELDPSWESAHRQAMRLLAHSGKWEAALAQFETCRRRLAEELDVEPAPETVALCEQIRDGRLAPSPQSAPAASAPPPHNLPAPLTPFIGREAELAELGQRLDDPACRLLTLVGPGGIGKTRLALEAARARLADYPHGVFQVRFVGLASTDTIVPTVAAAIGLRFGGRRPPLQQLTDYLMGRTMLLLLDNYEHLLEGAGLVVDLLRAAPNLKVLVTSREHLNVKGEHLLPVEGLAYPGTSGFDGAQHRSGLPPSAEDLRAYDAVQLFVSGAQRACPAFDLAGHTLDVARICNALEGLPLALLLASAWVGELSPAQIAGELSDGAGRSLDLLETEWRDVPSRHRGMRATFDHSWRLLDERLRTTFAALTVFRGGFDAAAAQAVAGASRRDLRRLVDRSFVQRLPNGRYEVHELMRQCGAEKLAADPEVWEAAHDRHCAYYTGRLEAWDADQKGTRQYEALAEMDLEIDNARAAWNWAVEHRHVARIDRAAEGLCRFYFWRVRMDEYRSACQLAEEQLEFLVSQSSGRQADIATTQRGSLHRVTAKVQGLSLVVCGSERRDELYERAQELVDLAELAGQDTRYERALILKKAARHFYQSDPGRARRYQEQSLALYRQLGDRWEIGSGLLHQAHAMARQPAFGEDAEPTWAEAQCLLEESLTVYQGLRAVRSEGLALMALGTLAFLQGRKSEGQRLVRQFIATWWEAGDAASLIDQLDGEAWTLLVLGRFTEACFVMEEGVRLYGELGVRRAESRARCFLAEVLAYDGAYAEARAQAQQTLAMCREEEDHFRATSSQMCLGWAALGQGQWVEAQHQWVQSAASFRELGNDHNVSLSLSFLGVAGLRLGDRAGARRHMAEALQLATAAQNLTTAASALGALSVMLIDAGRVEEAVEIYARLLPLPFFSRSRLWEDIAGRHIAAAAEALPPEVAAAARERGRARDLMETARELLAELEAQIDETASASGGAPSL